MDNPEPAKVVEKEPDLNDILGLNKKSRNQGEDFSDLLGGVN